MSLAAAVECLLFVAGEPVCVQDMARALCCEELEAESALRELQLRLGETGSGLQVLSIAGGFQLSTRPEHSEVIGRMLARSASRLSRAALETLAIIAYRQPMTIPELESIRGVASTSVMKTLLDRRLIEETGRRPTAGRPALYSTTRDFLHYFGLTDLGELPPLDESELPTSPEPLEKSAVVELPSSPPSAEPDSSEI